MAKTAILQSRREPAPAQAAVGALGSAADDKAMLKAAADLTRDLNSPNRFIYWADLLASAAIGYLALAAAILVDFDAACASGRPGCGARPLSRRKLHSRAHPHPQRRRARIPDGLEPDRRNSAAGPVVHVRGRPQPASCEALLWDHQRSGISPARADEAVDSARFPDRGDPRSDRAVSSASQFLAPLSLFSRKLRETVVAKYSGLQINPRFRRPAPEGEFRRDWTLLETACSAWAIALIALTAIGISAARICDLSGVASGVMFLNQVRTLVAHLWENDGEPMSVTAQFLDSVNVPPPATLPALWAPVGLRYHALHHLLPGPALSCAWGPHTGVFAPLSNRAQSITTPAIEDCPGW
jgi:hypothetical protein